MKIDYHFACKFIALLLMSILMLFCAHAKASDQVAAQDVADAIRQSPYASPWLRANADVVGRLAIFESGGRLSVYNNTCCTGVLQLNERNIREYANGMTRQQFAQLDLQSQVNAWSRLTSDALRSNAPHALDGRQVDGDLVLACVQLGIGNCQRMINSGKCSGFADVNGTTICRMADRIRGGAATRHACSRRKWRQWEHRQRRVFIQLRLLLWRHLHSACQPLHTR